MIKRLVTFFTTDISWKLLSVGLAFLLWLISWNFANPTENRSFELQLEAHNAAILENAGLIILNQEALDAHIRVGVRALRHDFEALGTIGVRSEYIIPSVDLRAITVEDVLSSDSPVTVRLDVSVNFLTEGLKAFGISPAFIDVIVDVRAREPHPISINYEGEIAPGLELMPIRLANSNVTITGPRSLLADIAMVQVTVDVLGIHSETEVPNLPLKVINTSGVDIADQLQLSVRETTAIVPVWPIESVELRVQSTGYLAPGFAVDEIKLEPNTIEIVASPERLAEIEYILLEIDLNNANETFTSEINVAEWLPSGVHLPSGGAEMVEATVVVEPIERRVFNVPRDNVRIRGLQAIYQIISMNAFIRVEVAGSRGVIDELTLNDIGLELDLRHLPIGIHYVVLNVSLPEGISLIQGAPALQVQIHEPAPPDAEDEPVSEPPTPPEPPAPEPDPNPNPVDDDEPEPNDEEDPEYEEDDNA